MHLVLFFFVAAFFVTPTSPAAYPVPATPVMGVGEQQSFIPPLTDGWGGAMLVVRK